MYIINSSDFYKFKSVIRKHACTYMNDILSLFGSSPSPSFAFFSKARLMTLTRCTTSYIAIWSFLALSGPEPGAM